SFTAPSATYFYSLSLHDALPIFVDFMRDAGGQCADGRPFFRLDQLSVQLAFLLGEFPQQQGRPAAHDFGMSGRVPADSIRHVCIDRKSTRLNSSHVSISYAVFCL